MSELEKNSTKILINWTLPDKSEWNSLLSLLFKLLIKLDFKKETFKQVIS